MGYLSQEVIALWTPGGASDGSQFALDLANYIAKKHRQKVVVAELPCLGIPRLAVHVDIYDKKLSTDTLLLDYDRASDKTSIFPGHYLSVLDDYVAVLPVNPYSSPDLPVSNKLADLASLVNFPALLKQHFFNENYSFLILLLQGQLFHPMTLMGLRESDEVILYISQPSETAWALACYKRLMEAYNQGPGKFSLFAPELDAKILAKLSTIKILKNVGEVLNRRCNREQTV